MKITDKILSIPPYISTSWSKVASLHMCDKDLIITLWDTTRIEIPDLTKPVIDEIFTAHASYLEQQPAKQPAKAETQEFQIAAPLRMLFGTLESITQAMQHNPTYSNLAPLPSEIVTKIQQVAKNLPPDELANYLHPVDGCNCMYCQISRILKGDASSTTTETIEHTSEEEVKEEDLRFEQWDVQSTGDKMYTVTNKLDPNEHYRVFLGDPIGCTCGKDNCEHIVAVLRH